MKASEIREGDTLLLKPQRRDAYGLDVRSITVVGLTYRNGYKTPHVWDSAGRAFEPRDFTRKEA